VRDFTLEWHDGETWQSSDVDVQSNSRPAWAATFSSVQTRRVRLIVKKTQDDISRIWEVELYQPVKR